MANNRVVVEVVFAMWKLVRDARVSNSPAQGNENVTSGPSRKMKVRVHMVPITIQVRLRSICFAGSLLGRQSRITLGNRTSGKLGPKPFSAAMRKNHKPLGLNKPANPATTPAVT